ncbi:MAG: zinc ABC transporter substrate-binding protein [Pseudomonadales bacterium]|nr:zinc ABC transporter substrate-binding protein [Pseudomonadales bacterium]
MFKRKLLNAGWLSILLLGSAINVSASEISVLATIKPIQLIVSQITQGVTQESSALLPPGISPHDVSLKISAAKRVKQASLILWLGPDVEPYLVKMMGAKAPSQQLNLSLLPELQHLALRSLAGGHHHGHHEEFEVDPHIWLSPENSLQMAIALVEKLSVLDSVNAPVYQRNLEEFKRDIEKLNVFRKSFAKQKSGFVVHHDAYQYLEAFMGLTPAAVVTVEPEMSPGVRHITEVVAVIKTQNIQCFVAGPTMSPRLVSLLFKGQPVSRYRVAELDPLAGGPFETYAAFMEDLSLRLGECVRNKVN